MFARYKSRIEAYCQEMGIEIPVGFERHAAERYVAIDMGQDPPKLVAMTWARKEDAVNYLVTSAAGQPMRLLDFEDRHELALSEKSTLVRGDPF